MSMAVPGQTRILLDNWGAALDMLCRTPILTSTISAFGQSVDFTIVLPGGWPDTGDTWLLGPPTPFPRPTPRVHINPASSHPIGAVFKAIAFTFASFGYSLSIPGTRRSSRIIKSNLIHSTHLRYFLIDTRSLHDLTQKNRTFEHHTDSNQFKVSMQSQSHSNPSASGELPPGFVPRLIDYSNIRKPPAEVRASDPNRPPTAYAWSPGILFRRGSHCSYQIEGYMELFRCRVDREHLSHLFFRLREADPIFLFLAHRRPLRRRHSPRVSSQEKPMTTGATCRRAVQATGSRPSTSGCTMATTARTPQAAAALLITNSPSTPVSPTSPRRPISKATIPCTPKDSLRLIRVNLRFTRATLRFTLRFTLVNLRLILVNLRHIPVSLRLILVSLRSILVNHRPTPVNLSQATCTMDARSGTVRVITTANGPPTTLRTRAPIRARITTEHRTDRPADDSWLLRLNLRGARRSSCSSYVFSAILSHPTCYDVLLYWFLPLIRLYSYHSIATLAMTLSNLACSAHDWS
ncbi:hypothetical protein EW146_g8548 [Bondarzewia mesenterica]|uniref:Uncharacterized protein n=1 Tax=Bondarzewia mesenterica TaxID=1095465 RepID=A0A4S4LDI7_9AGAM|nr:hypothetical protein EW146_g8548 [Bondarzewia mesenterica]